MNSIIPRETPDLYPLPTSHKSINAYTTSNKDEGIFDPYTALELVRGSSLG